MRGPTGEGESMTDQELVEILTLTCETDEHGVINYRNSAGKWHRVNGPAVIWTDGSRSWYQNDILHRTDGPAIECPGGIYSWWLNGKMLTEQEYNERIKSI